MRRNPILFVLFALLVLILSACTANPTAQPVAEPVEATATSEGGSLPTETTAVEPIPTGESYPEPDNAVPTDAAGYPSPEAEPPVSLTAPTAFPDPAGYTWQTVVSGFLRPVEMVDDGLGHMLVAEQPGRILVVEDGAVRGEPFLDITDRVGSNENEQGLLGLALHPRYAENGFLYVNYTDQAGDTVIARFTADAQAATARADSQKALLQVDQPYANHNGGGVAFGPDGFLYIGLGDGGSAGDPEKRGQSLSTLLGKLLRIDVDGGDPYAIPADNPYASGGGEPEIWAFGLRNPWRFSFDSVTGDLYIGDVGQNLWEEIDYLPANAAGGANFGWDFREGSNAFEGQPGSGLTLIDPIYQYPHPDGCSVTGGMVYRGQTLPEFYGIYVFGDYCTGRIWGVFADADGQWQNQLLFEGGLTPSAFASDRENELYLIDHNNGVVLKLVKK